MGRADSGERAAGFGRGLCLRFGRFARSQQVGLIAARGDEERERGGDAERGHERQRTGQPDGVGQQPRDEGPRGEPEEVPPDPVIQARTDCWLAAEPQQGLRSLDQIEKLLLQVTRRNDSRGYERFKDLFEAIVAYNE